MIETASRLAHINEYYFSQKLREIAAMRAAGRLVLNLGIGSPDLPPSRETIAELTRSACWSDAHSYQSYQGVPALRAAFSRWYERFFQVKLDAATEILPLLGSKEGIMHLAMTFLEGGTKALVPNPGYPAYRACSLLAGAEVVEYGLLKRKKWLPDLDFIAKKDLAGLRIFWVNFPNMPTGAQADDGFFRDLISFGKTHNCLIVNDNPYSFILNKTPRSLLATPDAMPVAVELNSLSKSQNMAGWRVGMLGGRAEILQEVIKYKSNMDSGMFLPVQLAAVRALDAPDSWYKKLNSTYRKRQKRAFQLLETLGCTFDRRQTGLFVWAKIPAKGWGSGFAFSDDLLQKTGVFITPGGVFGSAGDGFVRVSLCSTEEVFEESIKLVSTVFKFK